MKNQHSSKKQGFTLTETLIAFAILSGVTYVLFSGFLTSAKLSHRNQASLNETLFARLIMEQICDEVRCNPARIGQVITDPKHRKDEQTATIWGSMAKTTASPEGAAVLPAEECPFLGGLLKDSKKDGLQEAFGDFIAKMTVHRQGESQYGGATVLPEVTTEVTVDIYRAKAPKEGPWMPTETLSTEILTPIESMSLEAAKRFNDKFPMFDAREAKEKIAARLEAIDRYTAIPWNDESRSLLTSLLLLYRNVRLEQALTKGLMLGGSPDENPIVSPEKSLEGLITSGETVLQSTGSAKIRQQLAGLNVRTAQTILDSFKSSRLILEEDVLRGHQKLVEEIQEITESGSLAKLIEENNQLRIDVEQGIPGTMNELAATREPATADRLTQSLTSAVDRTRSQLEQYSSEMLKRRELWLRAQLFRWFMQEPIFKTVQDKLKEYPNRFPDFLKDAHDLSADQIGSKNGPTALQHLFALQDGIDLTHALRLYGPSGAGTEEARNRIQSALNTMAADFPAMMAYAETLRPQDPILLSMKDRFPGFVRIASDLAPLNHALRDEEVIHKDAVEKPIQDIGDIAVSLIRTSLTLKSLNRTLSDPSLQSSLSLNGPQRQQIAQASSYDPTGSELLEQVGVAFKMRMVPFRPEEVKPAPDWQARIDQVVQRIKRLAKFNDSLGPSGPGGSGFTGSGGTP